LVSHNTEDATHQQPVDVQDTTMENDRMALVYNKRKTVADLREDTSEFLSHAQRNSTHKTYNAGWKKWTAWCASQPQPTSPTMYDERMVLRFLLEHRHFSYQYLNGLRSSIASVFKVLYPEKEPLASQECILEFFRAKKRSEVKIPTKQRLQTWDTNILVAFIKKEWPDNQSLNLYDLQQKTILLLCLTTMARPRSDVGRVQYRDVQLELSDEEPVSVMIHFREAKETQVKSMVLGLVGDRNMCLVSTLFCFINQSSHLRRNLPVDHRLFLACINEPDKVKSASPSTIATWVSEAMKKAGIDTDLYKLHSIRSASSTKAVENGISISQVKQYANWSHRSNTFEKHYFKPTAQQNNSTNIAN
jgi:hypothetical protein